MLFSFEQPERKPLRKLVPLKFFASQFQLDTMDSAILMKLSSSNSILPSILGLARATAAEWRIKYGVPILDCPRLRPGLDDSTREGRESELHPTREMGRALGETEFRGWVSGQRGIGSPIGIWTEIQGWHEPAQSDTRTE
jgi:hypothetical protein